MRQEGYYWIRELSYTIWEVGYYVKNTDDWLLTGDSGSYEDSDFDEIDENRIVREDKCQHEYRLRRDS